MLNKRMFAGTCLRIHSGKPRLDAPMEFMIGPMSPMLERMLGQSLLTLRLECWADMTADATRVQTDHRGRRRTTTGEVAGLERVAGFDLPHSQCVEHNHIQIRGQATPMSSSGVLAAATPEQGYRVIRKNFFKGQKEFSEIWIWLVRLRAGRRSCFYPLPVDEVIKGKVNTDWDED